MDMKEKDREINRIVSNDKEWRRYIIKKLDKIEDDQHKTAIKVNTLEVKASFFGIIFGFISGFFGGKL